MCGKVRGESAEILQLSDILRWRSDYALVFHIWKNDVSLLLPLAKVDL